MNHDKWREMVNKKDIRHTNDETFLSYSSSYYKIRVHRFLNFRLWCKFINLLRKCQNIFSTLGHLLAILSSLWWYVLLLSISKYYLLKLCLWHNWHNSVHRFVQLTTRLMLNRVFTHLKRNKNFYSKWINEISFILHLNNDYLIHNFSENKNHDRMVKAWCII